MRFTARDGRGRRQTFDITEVRTSRPRLYRDEDKKSEELSDIEERLDELEKRLDELEKPEEEESSDEDEEELDEEEESSDEDLGSDDEEVSEESEDEEKVVDLGDSVRKPLYPSNRASSLRSIGAVASKAPVNDSADKNEDEIAKAWAERLKNLKGE